MPFHTWLARETSSVTFKRDLWRDTKTYLGIVVCVLAIAFLFGLIG